MYLKGFHINVHLPWYSNPTTDHGRNIIQLRESNSRIVRLPMFFGWGDGEVAARYNGGQQSRRFSNSDVDRYAYRYWEGTGYTRDGDRLQEIIILSPETSNPDDVVAGWRQVHHLCDWYPEITWFYEIGNELDEPDKPTTGNGYLARDRVLECLRRLNEMPETRKANLYLAVNMPSGRGGAGFFEAFTSPGANGRHIIRHDRNHGFDSTAPRVLTTHIYDSHDLRNRDAPGYAVHNWTLGRVAPGNDMNVKVTEAGIHVPYINRGARYVDAQNAIEATGNGVLAHGANAVMFYGTYPTELYCYAHDAQGGCTNRSTNPIYGNYGIRYQDAQLIGRNVGAVYEGVDPGTGRNAGDARCYGYADQCDAP